MSGVTTYNLLPTTTFGDPLGNYDGSSQDWYSDVGKAANYYQGNGSIQTVTFGVNDFLGLVTIQGTLDADSTAANWIDLTSYGEPSTMYPVTDRHPIAITGNFTYLRVFVQNFDQGDITVTVDY